MNSQIDRIMFLAEKGWKVYEGKVNPDLYKELACPAPILAKWFFEGTKAEELACVGCDKGCKTDKTSYFQPVPKVIKINNSSPSHPYYTLSPQEMVKRLSLLRVPQAAYCLNISERTVYHWISLGILAALKNGPVRVKAEDVARMMEDFDE